MKTFIIATDFSDTSLDVMKYGVEMAALMKVKVIFFHAFQTAITVPEAYAPVTAEELKQTAEKELKRLALEFRKNDDQFIDVLAVEGTMPDILLTYAAKYEDVLLLCGMKGMGKNRFRLFGSTTVALARKSSLPLLVVPEKYKLKSLNTLAFATDINFETDIQTLKALKELGEQFDSKLMIVRVTTKKYSAIEEIHFRSERLNVYLKKLDPQYEFIRSDDVTDGLVNFIDKKEVDMIALVPKHHDFLERIFNRSETKQMLHHTTIPLLLLPEQKIQYEHANERESMESKV